jgi:dipeptidyl aminopeptidase/acylaminoacyl peptidase
VLGHRPLAGAARDVTPPGFDVRTEVHEYGGGGYFVGDECVFFSSVADGRLHRQKLGGEPVPVTPQPASPGALRYADGIVVPGSELVVCVCESRSYGGVRNELVAFPGDGSSAPWPLVSGHDFVSFPCADPAGTRLAWTSWELPGMPFHGTELWVADLTPDGRLRQQVHVAGGREESIFQPQWSPDGELHFVSDRTGWWNLYRVRGGRQEPVLPFPGEFGWPQWFCSLSSYAFLDDGRIACLVNLGSEQRLGVIDPERGELELQELGFDAVSYPHLRAHGSRVVFIGASAAKAPAVLSWDAAGSGGVEVLAGGEVLVDPAHVAWPEPVQFASREGAVGRATLYRPTHPGVVGPPGERPPLVVLAHGGPTDQTAAGLRLDVQLLTSRGLAVLDVDYAGSTGYGRPYADRLRGNWGVSDVQDCIDAALHVVARGEADGERLAIVGGSAGGYIVLAALAFHDVFAAGVSLYGIADVETFAEGTHKFESGYCDWLVGSFAEAPALYVRRSPASAAAAITAPLLLLHGLEDTVVPPDQSMSLVQALAQSRAECEYLFLPGEGHGFRHAANVERAYGRMLEFLVRTLTG